MHGKRKREWRSHSLSSPQKTFSISLHPLFVIVGLLYALQGNLFLFLMSCLVALQHELAHAFASAKLGYTMRKIVLMPFGALLQGDLSGISLKDEITVAVCGPLCNLVTAFFFGALWWFYPTMYAFTDTAYYVSLSIALVNLIPAYPLDGGRILRAFLTRAFAKRNPDMQRAERKSYAVCKAVSFVLALLCLAMGIALLLTKKGNLSLVIFGLFLLVSTPKNTALQSYEKVHFSHKQALKKGVEVRRIAVADTRTLKDAFAFLDSGTFLVLDVYDDRQEFAFSLSQTELLDAFAQADTPYLPLREAKAFVKNKQ